MNSVVSAAAPLPQRDLWVELREIAERPVLTNAAVLRSAEAAVSSEPPAQRVRVHNGNSVIFQLRSERPVQRWQLVSDRYAATVLPSTQWLEAGRSLTARPRWPGGRQPVVVDVQADTARFDETVAPGSSELPPRSTVRVRTTVWVPLGQWITLAASKENADAGSNTPNRGKTYHTGQARSRRSLLQLRVELVE